MQFHSIVVIFVLALAGCGEASGRSTAAPIEIEQRSADALTITEIDYTAAGEVEEVAVFEGGEITDRWEFEYVAGAIARVERYRGMDLFGTLEIEYEGDRMVSQELTYPDGLATLDEFEYDEQGRLAKRTYTYSVLDETSSVSTTYDYDEMGRLKRRRGTWHDSLDYNVAGQLESVTTTLGGSGTPFVTEYDYLDNGSLKRTNSGIGRLDIEYDSQGRIEEVEYAGSTFSITYGPVSAQGLFFSAPWITMADLFDARGRLFPQPEPRVAHSFW